ncbi:hypothetical protein ACIBQX_42905 [Nonomuraea sp. NPDC049714]|uniref:hypothetical protein n=1 Tax=Nonomuraea sp. NPDC049714 TaxID=3364357 RepID=UPI0037AC7FFC
MSISVSGSPPATAISVPAMTVRDNSPRCAAGSSSSRRRAAQIPSRKAGTTLMAK